MNPPGAPDRQYVLARKVLLDVLDALAEHRDSIVLVGAQAVYLHTGESQIAVAEYTNDADLAIDPRLLKSSPLLSEVLIAHDFSVGDNPGIWMGPDGVEVDLLVPEAVAGAGRRGARLPPHGNQVARKAKGLEAALVENAPRLIRSLEPDLDSRQHMVRVAGPSALLIAKVHKVADRKDEGDRLQDKDALDVLRLLQAIGTANLTRSLGRLSQHEMCGHATRQALDHMKTLFAVHGGLGARMAGRATIPLEDPAIIEASCVALASDLLVALGSGPT